MLVLHPGADASQVQVALSGANGLELAAGGALKVRTGLGEVELTRPVAWQELDGQRRPVAVAYRLLGEDRYGFALGAHDPRLAVVIDPILQSTYLGGSGSDDDRALALSSTGEVYVTGYTASTNFPGTTGGAQATNAGGRDAFVARLSAGLAATLVADMSANTPAVPPSLDPGGSFTSNFSCTNSGPDPASNASCGLSASAGTVSGVSCTPSVPVGSLPSGSSITCSYTFTAPGTAGGGDTPETGVTFTVTASADNDSNAANDTAASSAIPIVDALDDSGTYPAGSGQTVDLAANDQVGGGPPSGATYTMGSARRAGASVSAAGVASFTVPASGSCTIAYQLCYLQVCDTATLTVTAQAAEPIPTLNESGFLLLTLVLAGAGVLLLRRLWA